MTDQPVREAGVINADVTFRPRPDPALTDDRLSLEYARLHARCEETIAQLTEELRHAQVVTNAFRSHAHELTRLLTEAESERDRAVELIAGLIFLGADRATVGPQS